jgi:hypothetical protein
MSRHANFTAKLSAGAKAEDVAIHAKYGDFCSTTNGDKAIALIETWRKATGPITLNSAKMRLAGGGKKYLRQIDQERQAKRNQCLEEIALCLTESNADFLRQIADTIDRANGKPVEPLRALAAQIAQLPWLRPTNTITEWHQIFEVVLNRPIDVNHFRRVIKEVGLPYKKDKVGRRKITTIPD